MSRLPSEATQLRNAKTEIRKLEAHVKSLAEALGAYRARATKAEQEVAEWKTRFDLLLRREETKL